MKLRSSFCCQQQGIKLYIFSCLFNKKKQSRPSSQSIDLSQHLPIIRRRRINTIIFNTFVVTKFQAEVQRGRCLSLIAVVNDGAVLQQVVGVVFEFAAGMHAYARARRVVRVLEYMIIHQILRLTFVHVET